MIQKMKTPGPGGGSGGGIEAKPRAKIIPRKKFPRKLVTRAQVAAELQFIAAAKWGAP